MKKNFGFDFTHFRGDLFGGITAGIVALPLALAPAAVELREAVAVVTVPSPAPVVDSEPSPTDPAEADLALETRRFFLTGFESFVDF